MTDAPTLSEFAEEAIRVSSEDAVRVQADKLGDAPGLQREGDLAVLTADKRADYQDIKSAFEARRMDPAEWVVERVVLNDWDVTAFGKSHSTPIRATNHQLKLFLRRAASYLRPARAEGTIYTPPKLELPAKGPQLVLVVSDHQIPYHDVKLHELTCQWIKRNKPDGLIILGDFIDFPSISKYDPDPENDTPVNEGIQAGYEVARDYVLSGKRSMWRRISPGNHDDDSGDGRLSKIVRKQVPALWKLRQAGGGPLALDINWLCRLDELGYERVTHPLGGYPHAYTLVDPAKIMLFHGWDIAPQAGASALKTTRALSESTMIGHTHRQGVVYETHGPDQAHRKEITAVESGTMSDIDKLTYVVAKNMQRGFATLTVWPDGDFMAENGRYRGGVLLWRDQRYE